MKLHLKLIGSILSIILLALIGTVSHHIFIAILLTILFVAIYVDFYKLLKK